MKFSPIHNHSEYSSLDGLSTCREIAQRCCDIGVEAAGISDHGTVSGHLEFAKVMTEFKLKPIFACELYHGVKTQFERQERDQAHFIAGALTDEGLRNLWRLVDAASTNFRFVGRVNWEMLEKYSEGVFATSACIQGLVSQGIRNDDFTALNRYLNIYKDNFYIEIHTYPGNEQREINEALAVIAQEKGVPLVYATDAHFAFPEQYEIHDAFVAMQTGEDIYLPKDQRKMWHPKALYIKDEEEIRESLNYLPTWAINSALYNTGELADQVNASLPETRRHLPAFVPSQSPWTKKELEYEPSSAGAMLIDLVERGIIERYGEGNDEAWDRATRELEVFLEAELEHYFLQAWDFCIFCDNEGIQRGPGRGSAAGSIVAYALGITDVDPIHYDLIFERFYNPGRAKGLPDIDCDFPKKDRKRVRQYLMDRWGHDKVRAIGTITRLKPKAACDRTYLACGITFIEKEELKAIIDQVPDLEIFGPDTIGWDKEIDPGKTIYVMDHVGDKIIEWWQGKDHRIDIIFNWLEILRVVCSRVSGYGVHPSGLVVSDVSLADELPCTLRGSKDDRVQATCFPMTDVDKRGFMKDDLLGLRNLDTLQDWEELYAAN